MGKFILKNITQSKMGPTHKGKGGKLGKIAGKAGAKRMTQKSIKATIMGVTKPSSEDLPEEVVSRESALSSMTRPDLFSEASSRTSSETQLPTPSMPRERPSPPSTSSMLSRDKVELSTVSEDEQCDSSPLLVTVKQTYTYTNLNFKSIHLKR